MNKKEKRLSIGFSIFLFLCAVINSASGQIGAAISVLGACIFYLALSLADNEKIKKADNDAIL